MSSAARMKLVRGLAIVDPGLNAVDALRIDTGLSRQAVKRALHCGALWLRDSHGMRRFRSAKRVLRPGELLCLFRNQAVLKQIPLRLR